MNVFDIYPDLNWLEQKKCSGCGATISRFATGPESSVWADEFGYLHDEDDCPES